MDKGWPVSCWVSRVKPVWLHNIFINDMWLLSAIGNTGVRHFMASCLELGAKVVK